MRWQPSSAATCSRYRTRIPAGHRGCCHRVEARACQCLSLPDQSNGHAMHLKRPPYSCHGSCLPRIRATATDPVNPAVPALGSVCPTTQSVSPDISHRSDFLGLADLELRQFDAMSHKLPCRHRRRCGVPTHRNQNNQGIVPAADANANRFGYGDGPVSDATASCSALDLVPCSGYSCFTRGSMDSACRNLPATRGLQRLLSNRSLNNQR